MSTDGEDPKGDDTTGLAALFARIGELETEVARQVTEIEFLNDVGDERHAEKVKLGAERDRLKAALSHALQAYTVGDRINTDEMRTALYGEGVTE